MTKTAPKTVKRKKETVWPGLLVGWMFVVGSLFLIAFLVAASPSKGKLVCDSQRRDVSLTKFGTCHRETDPYSSKSSFFSFW